MTSEIGIEKISLISYLKLIIIVVVVLSFIPVPAITFMIPMTLTIFVLFIKKAIPIIFYKFIVLVSLVLSINIVFNFFFNQNYLFLNSIISLITYSSVLLFFLPFSFKVDRDLVIWSTKLLIYFSLFQSILGLYQFFIKYKCLNYDAAVGTMAFPGAHEFNMKIILPCLLAFAIYLSEKRIKYLFFSMVLFLSYIVSFFNASFLILGLTFAIILVFFSYKGTIFEKKIKVIRFVAILSVIFLVTFIALFFAENIESTYLYSSVGIGVEKIVGFDITAGAGKIEAYYNTFKLLPREKLLSPFIGVGLGNYSSRSALYLGGEYSRMAEKILPLSRSIYTDKYIISLWNRELIKNPSMAGTLNQPFSSIQSVYGETGLFGIVILFSLVFLVLKRLRNGMTIFRDNKVGYIYFVFFIYTVYIFLMLSIDNYLEFPRVAMPLYLYLGMLWVNIDRAKKIIV